MKNEGPIEIALMGAVAVTFRPELEAFTKSPAIFHSVPDPADADAVNEALARASVMIGACPPQAREAKSVRLVQHVGAGVDGFRREELPPGAYLANVYGHESSVAEHVWMFLLALRRQLPLVERNLRRGQWPDIQPVGDLAGAIVGVVGFGRIGRALIPGARAFGVELMGITGHEPEGKPPEGVRFLGGPASLDRLLQESDAIVLSCPLTGATRGLIGAREIALMKPTAFLVNVARGPVADEAALYEALRDGRLAGAGIDTWYSYPERANLPCLPSRFPFHELENVILTPHIGGWSGRTREQRLGVIAENIDRIARGERPLNLVWGPRA